MFEQLQNALNKQSPFPLPTPPDHPELIRLFHELQAYNQSVMQVITFALNDDLDLDDIPDGYLLQSRIDSFETTKPEEINFLEQVNKFKQDLDESLECALGYAENQQVPSGQLYTEVYQAQGQLDASIMLAFLKANGIDAFSSQESAGVTYGLTVGPLGIARIYARTNQVDEARNLIHGMVNSQFNDDIETPGISDSSDG
jgi:hypothetical protein